MDIDIRFQRKPFADLKFGALFVGMIARRSVVRAIKAYVETRSGDPNNYFVTVGPFDVDLGKFPVLHNSAALRDEPVLELTGGYQFSPSLAPDDIMKDLPSRETAFGTLLLGGNQILMGVAEIESGGGWRLWWLNVKTGEVLPPPRYSDFTAIRRWRLMEPTEHPTPTAIFEFNAETATTRRFSTHPD